MQGLWEKREVCSEQGRGDTGRMWQSWRGRKLKKHRERRGMGFTNNHWWRLISASEACEFHIQKGRLEQNPLKNIFAIVWMNCGLWGKSRIQSFSAKTISLTSFTLHILIFFGCYRNRILFQILVLHRVFRLPSCLPGFTLLSSSLFPCVTPRRSRHL